MNRLWTRVFIVAACVLLLLFFSNDFGIIDIQKTAIVVAVGIDKSEKQEDKYDVTAQIAIPITAGTSGAEAACEITIRDTNTIGEAVAQINSQTGWFPTLVYCNLVLFGKDTTDRDVFDALDYFLRSDYVPDTALVAVVDGRCDEVLGSQSPINDMSATAITKTLSSEAQKSGTVSVSNLRDFAKGYYSPSQSGFLPMIEMKDSGEQSGGQTGGSGGSGESAAVANFTLPYSAGFDNTLARLKRLRFRWWDFRKTPLPVSAEESSGGGGSGKSGQQKPKIFKASKTALFKAGRMVGLLNEDETLALNVTTGDTELATIPIRMEEEGEEITYILQIKPESKGVKLKVTDDLAKFTVMIKCSAQITDASKAKSVEDITRSQIVQKKVLDAAEKQITETLSDVYTKSMESGCDVYGVQQSLYRHNYKYYEKMKDDILQAVHPEYSVKLHTLR